MAQRVQVLLVDDLDGGVADDTVTFALDGVSYEIDLATANAEKLRADLRTWIEHGRRVGGRAARGKAPRRAQGSDETAIIREWAKSNGLTVSERGRISAGVREAYAAAH